MEEWRRVFAVYSRLRTGGVELCKTDLKPFWGLWLADQSVFSNDDRDRAKRFLGIDQKVFILAASGPAANAGLRAGDVVSKIDGVIVEPQTWMSQGSYLQRASDVLAKADMRPVEIEISRSQGKYSVTLTPDVGCRYPLTILPDEQINAGATGNAIVIFSGILSVANTDDELAYVIGHELAHNALGHPGRSKSNEAVGGVIGAVIDIGILLGTRINTRGVFTQVGQGEGRKAYSQDFEREADYMSLYFMARSGFDATKAADMQRKLGIVTPGNLYSNYTATHPSTPERAANLELAIQEVAGKVFRHEPLVPTQLANQNVTTQDAKIDAVNILQHQVKVEPKRQAPEQISALRPIVADRISSPARWSALLTHVKGRTIFSPPTVLQAEYLEIEEGRGSSRVVYPGNYILEGEFRIQPRDQNFKGVVASRLIDPDNFIAPSNSSQKGFASYSNTDGTVMECSFSVSNDSRINQGTCSDNRGNQYRVSN